MGCFIAISPVRSKPQFEAIVTARDQKKMLRLRFPLRPSWWQNPIWKSVLSGLGVAFAPLLVAGPVEAAERVIFSYGKIQHTISLRELKEANGSDETKTPFVAAQTSLSQKDLLRSLQLQPVLTTRVPLDATQISRFLSTPTGQQLLDNLLPLFKLEASPTNQNALKAAAIAAASTPDGLTLLNLLQSFPADQIEIDLARGLEVVGAWKQLDQKTAQVIKRIHQEGQKQGERADAPLSRSPDFRHRGYYPWEKQSLSLYLPSRDRHLNADLYLPIVQSPRPVVVISHGLGVSSGNFAYLAQHLASYGFVVAAVEHPGSDLTQMQALFSGKTNRLIPPQEFIDRPQDVTDLLDELERLNQSDPALRGRLNLNQVGIIGQSFGGYTAMALAGATLKLDRLRVDCSDLTVSFNPSLLLQCRAQELPQTRYQLRDRRIKAAIAISPIGSRLIGPESLRQVQIPFMIMASSADLISPVMSEQIDPFINLGSKDKYLVLMQGSTHLSTIGDAPGVKIIAPIAQNEPDPTKIHGYVVALSTVFAQTHIAKQSIYRPYLSAAYTQRISEAAVPLSMVRSLSLEFPQPLSGSLPVMVLSFSVPAASVIYLARTRNRLPKR